MGANIPWQYLGVAPDAGYLLYRSEDGGSEYLIEEYNWVSAAEVADSIGADIINSSLGYTLFDDSTMNHTCAEMDGKTTVVTRGANAAAARGILVCNSAGNNGNSQVWTCISAPADGNGVMAVAAVDSNGNYASFSSKGKIKAGMVKPNVAAMGAATAVVEPYGAIIRGNGTSFASPLIAGLSACLWEASPGRSGLEIKQAIEFSSSQVVTPDSLLGYGIPDFVKAMQKMGIRNASASETFTLFPNPVSRTLHVTRPQWEGLVEVDVINVTGQILFRKSIGRVGAETFSIPLPELPAGWYLLKVTDAGKVMHQRFIKE